MTEVSRVVAPNPGPYTGPGTNTWIVGAGPVVVVIDPGPDEDEHLAALNKLQFPIPPLSEQVAIAAILSDMDAEIAALEAKLAKARQIKQGMMQELLTGRIRLA